MIIRYDKPGRGRPRQPLRLTAKQRRYVELQAQGLTRKEIARHTNESINTIGSNISKMLSRWDVRTITALVTKAAQLGQIDLNNIEIISR